MKKIVFTALIILAGVIISNSSYAQLGGLLDKAKSEVSTSGFDISKLKSSIMDKISPSLNLTSAQKPGVSDAIGNYLTDKSQILNLQGSNPTAYKQKQGSLFATLKSKLTGILLKKQMQKFMGMKPKTNNPSNSLSQLFY
jgi:hypothetical protein